MNEDDPNAAVDVQLSSVARFYGIALFGLFIILIVTTLVYTAFHDSLSVTLFGAEWSITFLANLVVLYFAFPAFNRTKNRAWLCVACAALIIASLALLSVLLNVMPRKALHGGLFPLLAHWFYAVHYIGDAVGMLLYASGVVSLARRATEVGTRKA